MAFTERHLVIVVGAGMAGLSAAKHLIAGGLTDVLVLEAGDRTGGRIHTRVFGVGEKPRVEMGASYIDGTALTNSAIPWANEQGLQHVDPTRFGDLRHGYFYRSDGRAIGVDLSEKAWKLFRSWVEVPDIEPVRHLHIHFKQRLEEVFRKQIFTQNEQVDVKAIYNYFLKWFMHTYGGRVSEMGLRTSLACDIPGRYMKIPAMNVLVQALCRDLKDDQIKLNHEVKTIDLENGTARIECSNGATFAADHVIVTCSLGYLKQNALSMFKPPLPEHTMAAIDRIGYGKTGKIFLEYERPFWTKGEGRICLAWMDEDMDTVKESEWYKSIGTIVEVLNNNNVLMAIVTSDGVDAMEQLNDESIKLTCTQMLRKFLRNPSIPFPVRVLKTDWSTNPLFRGSYSYFSNNTRLDDFQALATPIIQDGKPRLLFAGEAASGGACIQDARETGLRQAEVILAYHGLSLPKL